MSMRLQLIDQRLKINASRVYAFVISGIPQPGALPPRLEFLVSVHAPEHGVPKFSVCASMCCKVITFAFVKSKIETSSEISDKAREFVERYESVFFGVEPDLHIDVQKMDLVSAFVRAFATYN